MRIRLGIFAGESEAVHCTISARVLLQILAYVDVIFYPMSRSIEQVDRFAPLDQYSVKQRLAIRAADITFYTSIKLIGSTVRFDVRGIENLDLVNVAGKLPVVSFWHDRIFLGTYFFRRRGIVVMTSQSFDGEYIARFIQRFGYGAIRGSSTRGGSRALVEMIKLMRAGRPMGISVDGPRGPRYKVKAGVVLLAKKTGNPLVPFTVEPAARWHLRSWDKMHIPRPFTRALAVIGQPIYVAADADDHEIERKRLELQSALDQLNAEGESWRRSRLR
jgi:lysophospholipid acyltransferase (LPLAT)-like uncharacterized protein